MSHTCTPILMGGASLVSEILLPLKMTKIPFLAMDYSRSELAQKIYASRD